MSMYANQRIAHAEAVATGLRGAADYCRADQQALRERLLAGAQAIDETVSLLRSAMFVAKLNHDVLIARAE